MQVFGSIAEDKIIPGYFDVTEEILVIDVKNKEPSEDNIVRKDSLTWIMKRTQEGFGGQCMYYYNQRNYHYGPPSMKAVWPQGFWDCKIKMTAEQFYKMVEQFESLPENDTSEVGNSFVKVVRKFNWQNSIYRLENVSNMWTLVSEYGAKLPDFLKFD